MSLLNVNMMFHLTVNSPNNMHVCEKRPHNKVCIRFGRHKSHTSSWTLLPWRYAATLLPIIQQHVQPGTIVWSDEWAAYNWVQHLSHVAQDQRVDHSIEFLHPTTRAHRGIILELCKKSEYTKLLPWWDHVEETAWIHCTLTIAKHMLGYCSSLSYLASHSWACTKM